MKIELPEKVKKERVSRLLMQDARHSEAFRKRFLGRQLEILLEEETFIDGKKYYIGFTKEYVKCAVEEGGTNQLIWAEAVRFLPNGVVLCKQNRVE